MTVRQRVNFFEEFGNKLHYVTGNGEPDPPTLYRYRSVDTPYFINELSRLISSDELYWPAQNQLNDPFDCLPSFERGVTLKEFSVSILPVLIALQAQVSKEFKRWKISEIELRRLVKKELKRLTGREIGHLFESRFDEMVRRFFRDVLVLSMCEDFNNVVMWSMYGGRGNGVCLGFRTSYAVQKFGNEEWSTGTLRVQYEETRPKFDYWGAVANLLESTPEACHIIPKRYHERLLSGLDQIRFLWTKNSRWAYEQEFRRTLHLGYHVIDSIPSGQYVKNDGLTLSSIRIGPEVPVDLTNRILDLANGVRNKVDIFRAVRSEKDYSMSFVLMPT